MPQKGTICYFIFDWQLFFSKRHVFSNFVDLKDIGNLLRYLNGELQLRGVGENEMFPTESVDSSNYMVSVVGVDSIIYSSHADEFRYEDEV